MNKSGFGLSANKSGFGRGAIEGSALEGVDLLVRGLRMIFKAIAQG